MDLIRAKQDDFRIIRELYDDVIRNTPELEKHARWKIGSHPTDETIIDYIHNNNMYMCMEDSKLIGVMAILMKQDEDYHRIKWDLKSSENEVATLHIFAVASDFQGRGFGKKMIRMAWELAKSNGKIVFRLDTLASNIPAQKMYETLGFKLRGKQNLYAGNTGWSDFLYYERIL